MNRIDQDELDAFLWEVEHVSKGVKDIIEGRVDMDKIMEKERILKERKEKEAQMKKFKEEELKKKKEDRLKAGEKGKGEKDNYIKMCKRCFVEYQIELDKCWHCGRELTSRQDRHSELKVKVEELKVKKTRKKFRKQKYENWLKTENMIKKTTVNFKNYKKWDFYESSTDEEEKGEPIVPRNDPNFIALEKDITESQKKREISRNLSIKLKDEGNQAMKEGKNKKAIRLYTEAIEEFKGMMCLYTNRALAYIKRDDFDNAIIDCDKVIEYLDVFDEELKNNKEIYVKALTRKAQCCQKLKRYTEAKTLLEQSIKIIRNEEMEKMYANVLLEEEIHLKALNVIKGCAKQFECIDNFFDAIKQEEFEAKYTNDNQDQFEKLKVILKIEESNKLYFIQKGGLDTLFLQINKHLILLDLIELFNLEKKYILLINNNKGYNKLVNMLFDDKNPIDTNSVKRIIGMLEDASQDEVVRKTFSEMKHIYELFQTALIKYDISKLEVINDSNSVIILMRLYTLICNVVYSSASLRSKISTNSQVLMDQLRKFIDIFIFSNYLHTNLLESLVSFLINISCDESFRNILMKETSFLMFIINQNLKKIVSINFKKYEDLYEKSVSLLYNLTYKDDLNNFYLSEGIDEVIKHFVLKVFNESFTTCMEISLIRTLMLAVKLTKTDANKFLSNEPDSYYKKISKMTSLKILKVNPKIIDNTIKIIVHYISKLDDNVSNNNLLSIDPFNLISNLSEIFLFDYQNIEREKERVVNNMSLMISLVGRVPETAEKIRIIVKTLVSIAKDKTDLLRKNSAILLAKIAKASDSMQDFVRENHGMDVLLNIAKFIKIENKK